MPLVKLGPFALSSFGLTLLAALWLGNRLLERRIGPAGTRAEVPGLLSALVLVGGLLGARFWYALFNLDLYQAQPRLLWQLSLSAFAFPGALLLGGGGLVFYTRLRHQPVTSWSDPLAVVLPWGQALGMVGLMLSGEAYGRASTLPWAIPLLGVQRHPTQIYEALVLVGLAAWLWYLARRRPAPGVLTAHYLAGYGAIRLLLEPLRGDTQFLGGVRVAQVVGLLLVVGSLYWIWWRSPVAQASLSDETLAPSAASPQEETSSYDTTGQPSTRP